MKLNNAIESGKYRIYFALTIMIFIVAVAFMLIEGFSYLYLVIALIGIGFYIYIWLKQPYYINFETNHRSIILRFYNAHPFLRNPKAIEIPLHQFNGYEIVKKGLAKKIILKIKKGKQYGHYPPVSITIVPKDMLDKMTKELDTILKMKNYK